MQEGEHLDIWKLKSSTTSLFITPQIELRPDRSGYRDHSSKASGVTLSTQESLSLARWIHSSSPGRGASLRLKKYFVKWLGFKQLMIMKSDDL